MAASPCVWRTLSILLVFSHVCLICGKKLTHWYRTVEDVGKFTTEYNIQGTSMTWWDAARGGCSRYSGELLTLKSAYLPVGVKSLLSYGIYWIGALEFPMWKWTGGSTLYTYEGYKSVFDILLGTKIAGNSPLACHRHCGEFRHLFGLQGDKCFCLRSLERVITKGDNSEVQCPGSYYYKCGDEHGMSIYSIGTLNHMPYDSYKCGYARVKQRDWPQTSDLAVYLSPECDAIYRKCALCNLKGQAPSHSCSRQHDVCVNSEEFQTWEVWNNTCSLVKITPKIQQTVAHLIEQDFSETYCQGFWIGLSRYTERKWIDGRTVSLPTYSESDDNNPRCLAIENRSGRPRPFWTLCSSKHESICESLKRKSRVTPAEMLTTKSLTTVKTVPTTYSTTTVTTGLPLTPALSKNGNRPSTWALSTSTNLPSPPAVSKTTVIPSQEAASARTTYLSTVDTATVQFRFADTQQSENHSHDKTGVYVGSCISAVVLLLVLLLVIFIYRRRLLCFRAGFKFDDRRILKAHFNASINKADISVLPSYGYFNRTHSVARSQAVPIATIKPNCQNTSSSKKDKLQNKVNYSTNPSKLQEPVDFSNKFCEGEEGDTYDSHYEVPVSVEEGGGRVEIPLYSVVKRRKDRKIPANERNQATEGSNVGSAFRHVGHSEDNSKQSQDGQVVHAPDVHEDFFTDDDIYDTIRATGSTRLSDKDYNHIGGVMLGHTSENRQATGPDPPSSNNYSHTNEYCEENGQDHDDVYQSIDDLHIDGYSTEDDFSWDDEFDDMDDNCYYNLEFIPDTGSDNVHTGTGDQPDRTNSSV